MCEVDVCVCVSMCGCVSHKYTHTHTCHSIGGDGQWALREGFWSTIRNQNSQIPQNQTRSHSPVSSLLPLRIATAASYIVGKQKKNILKT